jgi:alkylation response protein AidB-like acyl-CoA dehydrogenase
MHKGSLLDSATHHQQGRLLSFSADHPNKMTTLSLNDSSIAKAFSDSARDLLLTESPLTRLRRMRGIVPCFERQSWQSLANAGWTSILIPEAQGGLGLGLREAGAVAEEIGRHPLPEPFIAAAVQISAALVRLPASELRDRLLKGVSQGELIIGLAWQEHADEIEPGRPSTVATLEDGQHCLRGMKDWVTPGQGANGWLVSALQGNEMALYWVESDCIGLSVEARSRIDGSSMARLRFDGALISSAQLLAKGAAAESALTQANDVARIVQGFELLGIARRTLEMTLEFLHARVQFGKPIGTNQALQHRAVDARMHLDLAAAALEGALAAHERGDLSLPATASRIKARCAKSALYIVQEAIQLHGAIGYTDEYDLGLYFKRVLHTVSWLGGEEIHCMRYFSRHQEDPKLAQVMTAVHPLSGPDPLDWDRVAENVFRATVRHFLHENYPQNLRHPTRRLHWEEIKEWYYALSRRGWIAPAWPRKFGGMGLPPDKLLAFMEELEAYGAARTPDQGIINLGPILIRHGTTEQQARYMPKIISGEHIWCQGYSEPGAGSDLASLRTEAILKGDRFVVNGQKIWTTLAHNATHIYLLVRTDKTVKQGGISFLLVDLKSPGITIRPIRNIADEEEFCEVFFDQVSVPEENMVGAINQGWGIAKALLGFERLFVGSPQQSQRAMRQLTTLADTRALFLDAAFCSRYARLLLDIEDLSAMYGHFADIVKRGEQLPASTSLLKIWATETYSRISLEIVHAAAADGGSRELIPLEGGDHLDPLAPLLNATITTIYGGTNEIQRNILAKQELRLPV